MRSKALVGSLLVLAGGLYVVHRAFFPPAPEAPAGVAITVESLPRPAGASGAALDVAARGSTWAACWEDGSVTVRRGGEPVRVAPPSGDESFRRAAVAASGTVIAITTRGRLFAIEGSTARDIGAKVQTGSRLATGPAGNEVWAAGEAGGLRRLDLAAGTIVDVWPSGDAPCTAVFAAKAFVLVGRVTGEVERGAIGAAGAPALLDRLEGTVTVIVESGGWVVAGDDRGRVRSKRPKTTPSGASAIVFGAVVALALPPPREEGRGDGSPLLVVHAPGEATLLEGGAYERRSSVALGSAARAGCPLDGGQALLVGTDAGEKIVKVLTR